MKKYKKFYIIFFHISIIIFVVMCAHVTFEYKQMLWGIKHLCYSAPARIVFILCIPYLMIITCILIITYVFWKKQKNNK